MSWFVPRLYLTMFTNNSSIDRSTGRRNAGSVRRSEKKRSVAATMACSSWMERLNVISTCPHPPAPTSVATRGGTLAPRERIGNYSANSPARWRCLHRGIRGTRLAAVWGSTVTGGNGEDERGQHRASRRGRHPQGSAGSLAGHHPCI